MRNTLLHDYGNNEPNDPETVIYTDEPPDTEQTDLFEFED